MQYLIDRFNSEFVFNKAAVEKLVDNGEFDFINWDNASSLYRLSNRKSQVCEMFQLGYEHDLMAPTKGHAIEQIAKYAREYKAQKAQRAQRVQRVNAEFNQAAAYIDNSIEVKTLSRKLECTSLYAMSLEDKVAELEQQLVKAKKKIEIKDNQINKIKEEHRATIRQILCNNVIPKAAAKIAGKVAKVAQTEIKITIK